jgi:hypothetical protein
VTDFKVTRDRRGSIVMEQRTRLRVGSGPLRAESTGRRTGDVFESEAGPRGAANAPRSLD